ncbi:uncharacterized protein LOC105749517 [Sarcophilus harrisii]|uniref:uncharacterized protein LOC105749517 n=1 Tax=Sarcophilus harrisii TaxID=9305 RepID=UPI001301E013|nr:uncharacterized protein LOC105749517 [Sarcophilus harrisii]
MSLPDMEIAAIVETCNSCSFLLLGSRKSSLSTMNTNGEENSSSITEIEDKKETTESVNSEDNADGTQNVLAKESSLFCPLSKLFLSADALIKENEKSHNLKKHEISITEAKNYLLRVLNIISLETLGQEEPLEPTQPVVLKSKSTICDPIGMMKILRHNLLSAPTSSDKSEKSPMPLKAFAPLDKFPSPMHIFPYELLAQHCLPFLVPFIVRDDIRKKKILCRIVLFNIVPPKGKVFRPQGKRQKHFEKLRHPEKQFMDLKDLQRKYYKGLLKWKKKPLPTFKEIIPIIEKTYVPEMLSMDYKVNQK